VRDMVGGMKRDRSRSLLAHQLEDWTITSIDTVHQSGSRVIKRVIEEIEHNEVGLKSIEGRRIVIDDC
jgi:hypothetical protein